METIWNSNEKIWSCDHRKSIYGSNTSVGQIAFNNMKNWPSHVCQISDSDGVTVTNEQAITWAIRIAQFFKNRGLDHRSVVGIIAANSTYVMPLAVACLLNTTPFHAVNPLFDEDTIRELYKITRPKLIFCDKQHYNKIYEATKDWAPELFTVSEPIDGKPNIQSLLAPTSTEASYEPEPLKDGSDQTVAILCSSGTTGMPKAVCVSNKVLYQDILPVNSETILFLQSTLDWASGLWGFMLCTVFGVRRILSDKPFSPENFMQLVQKYKINFVFLAPVQMAVIGGNPNVMPYALSSLRYVYYGGSIASRSTLNRMQELCKNASIHSAYAMTEVGMITQNKSIEKADAAGQPVAGVKIRIVDDDGKNLGHNEQGEILVHTGFPWNGYYSNPVATRQIQDFQGWFHTGDLGYFDHENYLHIVDRKKEILKFKGYHYWPTEIENIIKELAQVLDVCVVGVADDTMGDKAGALVVRSPGSTISDTEIMDHVIKRIVEQAKHLHAGVQFTEKLPINFNGKTLRKQAQKLFISLCEHSP